ncbi:MAG: right-handed parallel beta-helix repeat-containing protein [Bacteroidales bacterium]|nr:right-handed parallel beta-helix repeat-containing protein [Bacteroidales bacterium]
MKKIQWLPLILVIFCNLGLNSCKKENDSRPVDDYSDYSFEEPEITGTTFYIDPINGSSNGDGSSQNPWRTLQEVIEKQLIENYQHSESYNANSELVVVNEGAPVKGGDRLVLLSGYHGFIDLNNFIFKDWLRIEAGDGQTPVLSQFKVTGAFEKFYLKGLTIKKDSYQGIESYWLADDINHNTNACLYLGSSDFWGKGKDVKISGLTVKTTDDISGWNADEWVEKVAAGISLRSVENIEIYNCTIENISLGVAIEYNSDYSKVVGNNIRNYSLDGMRLISNNVLLANNSIVGCYKVDENHDDAIQSYSRGADGSSGSGVLYNNVIRGNLIVGITGPEQPLQGTPQGIGCFDGFFDGWIVENNVIITNHYHGISFYGMRNSKIANNTVIDQIPGDDLSPWIMITDHKNGTPSENCLIVNNIVSRAVNAEGNNVLEKKNYIIGHNNYSQNAEIFINPDQFNFHLLINDFTNQNIIDKGEFINGLLSSEIDKDNVNRTVPPDIGAYEAK